ncbi:coproporphyrinogen-III oxidase family protein [Clostridium saccharoperbutylacetonicum]|uniref:coproporphyrinogen-III oxidase family protein n=1 Tax=Clostridium saccharoperbutylacetonicum TaxID=36745 RepID=UPI000983E45B|nr:radical SAM protein [Clostridium saccharoperbutylacetonicum]AQR93023.1 oxygen-independent coproporphyrinogen-III oxidase-like protein [Clostridium saccharoperbutylacetonicum]NSB34434.1 oxygen-independent coproporphyrinogen-3 oxidase [Clostridium saccharoperbutylacetonicum]
MSEMFRLKDTEHYDYPQLSIFHDVLKQTDFDEFLKDNSYNKSSNTALYIHIPFCRTFCIFCNYYKEKPEKKLVEQLISAIIIELKYYADRMPSELKEISAVHFGGGTPTSIGISGLQQIMETIKDTFDVKEKCLFSIEGHIRDLHDSKFVRNLKKIGFNRVSFGIQTFSTDIRKKYGLLPISEVDATINNLKEYGFEDYNVDLMYNFPEQNCDEVVADINKAFDFGVNCIDLYSLNVFPNTKMENFLTRHEMYKKYIDIEKRSSYLGIYEYLEENKDCKMVMSNTISRKMDKPNLYLNTHLGANKLDGGRIIGIGPSSRGYVDGFAYKNHLDVNGYISAIKKNKHGRYLEHKLSYFERQNRLFVMFPNFTYIKKKDAVFNEYTKKTMDVLLENRYVYEDGEKYYIKPKDCYWAGNISAMFYSEEQREKMIKTLLLNRKNKLNMYNQDKMQIIERDR